MSAVRDHSQRIGFIYTNLYAVYKQSQKAEAKESAALVRLKNNLGQLNALHFELKQMLEDLRKLVE